MRYVIQKHCRDLFIDPRYLPNNFQSPLQDNVNIQVEYTHKQWIQKNINTAPPKLNPNIPKPVICNKFSWVGKFDEKPCLYRSEEKKIWQQNNFKTKYDSALRKPQHIIAAKKAKSNSNYKDFKKRARSVTIPEEDDFLIPFSTETTFP